MTRGMVVRAVRNDGCAFVLAQSDRCQAVYSRSRGRNHERCCSFIGDATPPSSIELYLIPSQRINLVGLRQRYLNYMIRAVVRKNGAHQAAAICVLYRVSLVIDRSHLGDCRESLSRIVSVRRAVDEMINKW